MKFNLLLLLALCLGSLANAQTRNPKPEIPAAKIPVHLHLKTRNYGDRIAVRWGFSEPSAWRYLNKQGFILERFELDDATNKAIDGKFYALGTSPMRPWTEAEWAAKISTTDTFAVVAAGCLLSESKIPEGENFLKQLNMKAQDESNRTAFALFAADMSPLAAEGLALRFDDRDVKPSRKYVYRIRVNDDPADQFQTDTAIYMVATDLVAGPQPPDAPEIQPGDSLLTLRWRKITDFTAWHVERSGDGGATWKRLTRKPYLVAKNPKTGEDDGFIHFPDRGTENYKPYQYRILGISPFGELSEASQATEAQSIDLTPTAAPMVSKIQNTVGVRVDIEWKMPPVRDCKGFIVSRSESAQGPWMPIHKALLSPEARSISDTAANEFGRNFYCVFSVDEHDNTAPSNPAYVVMNNTAPPAAPVWTSGKIDTNGVVTLRWKLGTEPDLWGYQIYYANQHDHELVPLTGNVLVDTVYTYKIPLDNLTEEIFYTIRAVDVNYHISEHSEKLKLAKPDKVPPVAPVFQDFAVRDTGVLLIWAASTSKDVAKHFLLRREKGQTEWQTLAELSAKATRYFDDEVAQKKEYEYVLYAVDDAGLASPKSFPLQARALPRVLREPIEDLRCMASPDKKSARLTWDYPEKSPGKVNFKVYRIAENGSLKLLGETSGAQLAFEDKNIRRGEAVRYAVRAFHRTGGASPVARTEALNF